jgi:hypothetical protein
MSQNNDKQEKPKASQVDKAALEASKKLHDKAVNTNQTVKK